MDYRFERIDPSKMRDFQRLYVACHPSDTDEGARFAAKFDTAAFGAAWLGYLAYHRESGAVAGYYGVFPCPLVIDGRPVVGAQSGDTMTHPEHRRKGLFVELAERTYALAADEGVKYLFGIPNANSYPGFVKMGWEVPGTFRAFTTSYAPSRLGGAVARRAGAARLKSRRLAELPERSWWGRGESYVSRGRPYLAYKGQVTPSMVVRLGSGYAWLRTERARIVVGDLFAETAEGLAALWHEIAAFARRYGFYGVDWFVSPQAPAVGALSAIVAPVDGPPLIVRDLGAAPRAPLSVVRADFDTF